jgi:aryl-alcohol dehydrogenase-like predicted oxidoreductase
MLPHETTVQFTADLKIQRLLNGMWQVSGAHGNVDAKKALAMMLTYHQDGYTTWDLADHYGPAEDLIGRLRDQLIEKYGYAELERSQAFTKWVPRPMEMTRAVVEHAVNVSLRRMKTQTLDLLQFHWWDYRNPAYLTALDHLSNLRDEGKIRHLALTNFDTSPSVGFGLCRIKSNFHSLIAVLKHA